MLLKETTFALNKDNTEILDGELFKTAAIKLPAGFQYDKEYLYLIVRAVSAGEYWGANKNQDYFPEEELKSHYRTFLAAHVFKNHENKQIENAIGDILSSEWDDDMKCIKLLIRIDRKLAPNIVRGFEKGYMTDVSMGCRIDYSVCSVCGNKAKTKFEYCTHIRTMRGRILDDGKLVCEINIGPKFHDISAVLTGAERSAKVLDLKMDLSKESSEDSNYMEKAASLQPKYESEFYKNDIPLLLDENKLTKEAKLKKIAEIKKEIQGKIIGKSLKDWYEEKENNVGELSSQLKFLYTDFLSGDSCSEIGKKLSEIADNYNLTKIKTFGKFLEMSDYSGIELSPMEIHRIYSALIGKNTPNHPLDGIIDSGELNPEDISNSIQHHIVPGINVCDIMNTIPGLSRISNKIINSEDPLMHTKAIIIRIHKNEPEENNIEEDIIPHIMELISPMLHKRSMHTSFLNPRVLKIASEDISPNEENIKEYAPVVLLQHPELIKTASDLDLAVSGLLWVTYEKERVDRINSDDYDNNIIKTEAYLDPEEFEKEAVWIPKNNVMKSILIGIPVSYGYSAYQRSKMKNGQYVSDLNRTIGEHPGMLSLVQLAIVPDLIRDMKRTGKKSKGLIGKIITPAFAKHASEIYSKDIFSDKIIDSNMKLLGYSDEKISNLKIALLSEKLGNEDQAIKLLEKFAMSEEDLEKYLQNVKDSVTIEIEKNAGNLKDFALGEAIFGPSKGSLLARGPGVVIDAGALALMATLNKLISKIPKKFNSKPKI